MIASAFSKVTNNLYQFFTNRKALATGLTFSTDSLMFGSWITYIPYVKSTLGMNDAQLGFALFGMPVGLLLMNPFSARVIARFGLAQTTTWSTVIVMLGFAVPVWMPDRWLLLGALILNGVGVALLNVCMNTCATTIEQTEKTHIMSTCHGMWSLGGMVGSGMSAALIAAGVPPTIHLTVLAVVISALTLAWVRPVLATIPGAVRGQNEVETPPSKIILPSRDLMLMIFIGLVVSMCEGVAFDWSGVYLRDVLNAPAQMAALGFTCFSLTMMGMRFIGDVLIPRFGERNLLYFSAFQSMFALVVIIIAPNAIIGITGFLLLGAGVAMGAPILFNAAARIPGLAPGAGLATYATFSFMGFLAGPPAIGWIGEHFSLNIGFALVAILCCTALWAIRQVRL